jgi:hypothetical protein
MWRCNLMDRPFLDPSFCEEKGHPPHERAAVVERVESTIYVVCLRCGLAKEAGYF